MNHVSKVRSFFNSLAVEILPLFLFNPLLQDLKNSYLNRYSQC